MDNYLLLIDLLDLDSLSFTCFLGGNSITLREGGGAVTAWVTIWLWETPKEDSSFFFFLKPTLEKALILEVLKSLTIKEKRKLG